jgi:sensor histidine kinase YesM
MGIVTNYLIAILIPILFSDLKNLDKHAAIELGIKVVATAIFSQLLCALYYYLFGGKMMSQFCGWFITLIYAIFFCKYNINTRVTMSMAYASTVALVPLFCYSFVDLIATISIENLMFIIPLHALLMVACVIFLKAFSLKQYEHISPLSIGIITFIFALSVIFWAVTNAYTIPEINIIVVVISLLVTLFFAYYSAYSLNKNINEQSRRREEQLMMQAKEHMYRLSESNLEDMRKIRHELNNQYAYMKMLLEMGDYERLTSYFQDCSSNLKDMLYVADCGNDVVNAVLNIAITKANQTGAKLEYNVSVPNHIHIPDIDISSFLLNLLNNAIEYISGKPTLDDKTIKLNITMKGNTLYVDVSNCVAYEDSSFALNCTTTKTDKNSHGYGSKIIKSIAQKYNGSIVYEYVDGRFNVSAILCEELLVA